MSLSRLTFKLLKSGSPMSAVRFLHASVVLNARVLVGIEAARNAVVGLALSVRGAIILGGQQWLVA